MTFLNFGPGLERGDDKMIFMNLEENGTSYEMRFMVIMFVQCSKLFIIIIHHNYLTYVKKR